MTNETTTEEQPTTTIAEYDSVAAGLAELRGRYKDVTYAVTTSSGMKLAVEARATLRNLRLSLDKTRKTIKAPALQRCRDIDGEAKRITAELVALESPIDEQIKAEQQKRADAKAAKERAEAERVAAIERERVEAEQAERNAQIAAERAEIERQKAALEQQRAAQEAELKAEREAAAKKAAAAQAIIDADRAKADAAAAAEREQLAAEEAQRQAEARAVLKVEQAAARAESERLAAEWVQVEEQQRLEQEAKDADEIEHATLLDAAREVVAMFDDWNVADQLPARKLVAAVERADRKVIV